MNSDVLSVLSTVKSPSAEQEGDGLSFLSSMAAGDEPVTDFGRRLDEAIRAKKITWTRTERESGLQQGYLSQVKRGRINLPGADITRALADYLDVDFEWLSTGKGAMQPAAASTPLGAAKAFALTHGVRSDAIAIVVARHQDVTLTGIELVNLFDAESRRLDREGVPRSEEAAARERKAKRLKTRSARADASGAKIEAEIRLLKDTKADLVDSPSAKKRSHKK